MNSNLCLMAVDRNLASSGEEWRPIPWAPRYLVSSFGSIIIQVNATHPERRQRAPMRLFEDKDGYLYLRIAGRKWLVHRLVYAVFIGPLVHELVVCHLDGDRKNNCQSNLLQTTQYENIQHKRVHGTWQEGEKHPHARYDNETVRRVKRAVAALPHNENGHLRRNSAKRLALQENVPLSLIYSLRKGGWAQI